ncbi:MAG: PilT/PilU family type 4a pilus ATPase [Roseibacillus sp.]
MTHQAERLVLVPEDVPTLFKTDEAIPLSMPAVPGDLVKRLALEVIGADHSEALAVHQPLSGTYRTDEGEEFTYQVSTNGAGCRIEMHFVPEADSEAVAATDPHLGEEGTVSHREGQEPAAVPRAPAPQKSELELESAPGSDRQSLGMNTGTPVQDPDPIVLCFLEHAVNAEASDIFLSSGKPAQMRLNGVIQSLDSAVTTDAQIRQLIPREDHQRELERNGSVDFGVRWKLSERRCRFRINVFYHSNGLAAALRPIRTRIPSLAELQLPSNLLQLCSYPSGLVLLTGASGSGKSTTLAALVEHINQTVARHIITIEDPIEFEHRDHKSLIHQREVGANVESFSSGLRAALRENPDVILLGEMRDLPTISAALTAAETGHLVLSTLHTGSATAAVNRIVDVFPGHQQAHIRVQLASSLRAVVAQRLVPTVGNRGRIPAIEKLIVTPAVANTIRDGKEHHMRSAMQTGVEEGMITLERSLAALECSGKISRITAFRYAADQQALQKLFE